MSKRSNPFVDDYIPQSKVHFGMKQFNNNEDGLRKVYEKTLDLLYKGAKKAIVPEIHDLSLPIARDKRKQLFIGKNGALLHSGTLVQSEHSIVKKCECNCTIVQQCAYCEKAVCDNCRHLCCCCDQSYCSHCSLIGSEGAEVCVSCYS